MLEIRYRHMRLQTSKGKKKRYPDQMVTVIEAREQETPPDRDRIDWKLITDLAVKIRQQAMEKVQWYALRWKIEVFHKILKSGCRAEQARLRTAPTADESTGGVLHPELACLLAYHDQSHRSRR